MATKSLMIALTSCILQEYTKGMFMDQLEKHDICSKTQKNETKNFKC